MHITPYGHVLLKIKKRTFSCFFNMEMLIFNEYKDFFIHQNERSILFFRRKLFFKAINYL